LFEYYEKIVLNKNIIYNNLNSTTTDMSKKFCPQCGHDTLIRTSVSIDKYGNKVYHLKKNFNYRLRGTKVYNKNDDNNNINININSKNNK